MSMPGGNSIRAVLFDWDGTLLDSYHADARAYLEMFRALGVNWGLSDLERHYSPDWYRVYRAARIPRSRWEEADRLWRRAYRDLRPKLLPPARAASCGSSDGGTCSLSFRAATALCSASSVT